MHEYSIVQALLDRVEATARQHGAGAVQRVRVRIGEMSGVEADLLRSAFELCREQTVARGAELDIVPVAVRWTCPACERTLEPGRPLRCPACDRPARLAAGDEILLERLEMEVA